jgi:glyoxylase-like metal-dependent hydrolase (beta-lactamase superfamily II)
LGPLRTNCYIVASEKTKNAILFDPADSADEIHSFLNHHNYNLKIIALTHTHFDHILALNTLKNRLNPVVFLRPESEATFKKCFKHCIKLCEINMNDLEIKKHMIKADKILNDGDTIELDGIKVKSFHTPGHSDDSCCFLFKNEKTLISGDTLFYNSIGRTDIPTGNFKQEIESIKNKLFVLENDVKVYPGHGWETTIGFEKRNNQMVLENIDT